MFESTGTTRKSASAGVVTGIDMQLPPRDMLLRFEEQVVPLRGLLTALVQKNVVLRRTRDQGQRGKSTTHSSGA
jgi:type I restriction enzyme, S subunit